MPESRDNGIARLQIPNFSKHLDSLKKDNVTDNNIISSEHLNGSGLHLNRHGKGKLVMNLIKKLRELRRKNSNRNCQQSGQSLVPPQYYDVNFVCNSDYKRKSDTAGLKHLLEIESASSSTDFQDTGNQINVLDKIRIKNADRLMTGHLNKNCIYTVLAWELISHLQSKILVI